MHPIKPSQLRKIPGFQQFKDVVDQSVVILRKIDLDLAMNLSEYFGKFFGKKAEFNHFKIDEFHYDLIEVNEYEPPKTLKTFFYDDFFYSKALREWMRVLKSKNTPYALYRATHQGGRDERFTLFVTHQKNQ